MSAQPTELRACPFCGGAGKIYHNSFDRDYAPYCDAESCHGEMTPFSSEADAIAAWNTRAPDPALLGKIERLEAEKEEAITHLTLVMGPKLCGETDWSVDGERAYPTTTFGALKAARAFVTSHSRNNHD